MILSTRDAADKLGTTPKVLRQFLRQSDAFGGVGSGARYGLDSKSFARLEKAFNAWASTRALKTMGPDTDGEPGLPTSVLKKNDPKTRALIKARAEARVDRLEASLKAHGLHVSQMTERPTFRS